MQTPVGRDHTLVVAEHAAGAEVERPTRKVGDTSAGLFYDQRPRRVIPNLIAEDSCRRQPQHDVGASRRDHRVLGLPVHRLRRYPRAQGLHDVVKRLEIDVMTGARSNHARRTSSFSFRRRAYPAAGAAAVETGRPARSAAPNRRDTMR
jgi:hypothetical protein